MFAGQLTIWDVLDELDDEQHQLSRLGAGPELGMVLLRPLLMRGWRLHDAPAFAAPGRKLFILANSVFEVKREGATLGDVVVDLVEEAVRLTGVAA